MAPKSTRAKKEAKTEKTVVAIESSATKLKAKENIKEEVGAEGDIAKIHEDLESLSNGLGTEKENKYSKTKNIKNVKGKSNSTKKEKDEKKVGKKDNVKLKELVTDDGNKSSQDNIPKNELEDFHTKAVENNEDSLKPEKRTNSRGKKVQNKKNNTKNKSEQDGSAKVVERTDEIDEVTKKPQKRNAKKEQKEESGKTNDNVNEAVKISNKKTKPSKKNVLTHKQVKNSDEVNEENKNMSQNKTNTKEITASDNTEEPRIVTKSRGRGKKDNTEKLDDANLVSKVSPNQSVPLEKEVKLQKGKSSGKKRSAAKEQNKITDNNEEDADTAVMPQKKKRVHKKESNSAETENKTTQAAKGKRKAPKQTVESTDGDDSQNASEPSNKKAKTDEKKPLKNKSVTSYDSIDFSNSSTNSQGQPWNLKICSWNVDGIRAWLTKGGLDYIKYEKPDILCLQEVKCAQDKLPKEVVNIPGYHPYWLCSDKDGYAGVGIYTTKMAINVQYGIQDEELDTEGRIITAEYEQFYLISTYVPNAGRKLVTLPKKLKWNEVFHKYVKELDAKKAVIICGDMNVAHNEIDLANPKTNKKNAGFTPEEREGMTALLNDGFVDTFRRLNPEKTGAYTFWTYMMNSRAKNVGWRLDYMIISERLLPALCDSTIRSEVYGSDHCPIALFLHLTSVPKIPTE